MNFLLDIKVKLFLSFLLLIYASIQDWKYREIDNKIPLSMVSLGIVFLIYDFIDIESLYVIKMFSISIGISFLLVTGLYYAGLMGGGDGKILIGIAALIPVLPYPTYSLFPIFSLSVLTNAIFISALLPLAFFLYNIRYLKEVSSLRSFLVLFLGYKKMAKDIANYEVVIGNGNKYSLFIHAKKAKLGEPIKGSKKVWVTPALPFAIFITAGFMVSAVYGDLISYIIWNWLS